MNTTFTLPIVIESRREALKQYQRDYRECQQAQPLYEHGVQVGTVFQFRDWFVDWSVITTADGTQLYRRTSNFYEQTVSPGFGPGERYFPHD